jgi:hypothetical protein
MKNIKDQVYRQIENRTYDQIWKQVTAKVFDQIWIRQQIENQLWRNIKQQIRENYDKH